MTSPWWKTGVSGHDYDARFAALERAGQSMHGEADFVETFGAKTILDAGCGTGRVAIELARRGADVVGIDRDADMLAIARAKAPHLAWYHADLASVTLNSAEPSGDLRLFDVIVMAGNVMIFLDLYTEEAVMANMARHLTPGGVLVVGFQLHQRGFDLDQYDAFAARAGLELTERWATWDRQPWQGTGDYAVSVHRRPSAGS